MTSIATKKVQQVIRPLRVIEAELKPIFDEAEGAAEEARQPYYKKAAPLLLEAREGHFMNETAKFYEWAQKKFGISRTTTTRWVLFGADDKSKSFKHLDHFVHTPKSKGGLGYAPRATPVRREWAHPVDEIASQARKEAFRISQEEALNRAQERDAMRKLSHRLIAIGYRVLSKELHPDKMHGNREAMARLNRVKDILRDAI